jgi:phage N-6-adenine-methyltransferase
MSDEWATPQPVFNALDREFNFGFDVCAEHETAKCPEYWTIEDDALSKDWAKDTRMIFGKYLFCNPPYSKIGPWVDKAVDAQFNSVGTVMLCMCDPSVKWFGKAISYASEIRFITNGRLAFLKDGVEQKGNNKGSVIFIFEKYIYRSS